MSTNDVPGHKTENHDELSCGCWAEHEDGSLIFVLGNEGGKVMYEIFDMAKKDPVAYRDAMPEDGFKDQFSWDKDDPDSIQWTWHDKTPFPWDRIMKNFDDGTNDVSAAATLSAAEKVAASLALRQRRIDPDDYAHLIDTIREAKDIQTKLQDAIAKCPT